MLLWSKSIHQRLVVRSYGKGLEVVPVRRTLKVENSWSSTSALRRIKIKFCILLDLQLLLTKKLFSSCDVIIYDVINMNFGQNSVIENSKFAREETRSEQQFGSCQVELMTSQTLVTSFVSFNPNSQTVIVKILDSSMLFTINLLNY